ncbi:MAG TPA: hypothetical protein VF209_04215 [Patescibacteria group bacterium]
MKLLDSIPTLIIEPNILLMEPYSCLPFTYQVNRYPNLEFASESFLTVQPQLVMLSASFSPTHIITFLEKVKNESVEAAELIPIIFVIDLENPLSFIPGTTWGKQIGVITSLSSPPEVYATLQRVLTPA